MIFHQNISAIISYIIYICSSPLLFNSVSESLGIHDKKLSFLFTSSAHLIKLQIHCSLAGCILRNMDDYEMHLHHHTVEFQFAKRTVKNSPGALALTGGFVWCSLWKPSIIASIDKIVPRIDPAIPSVDIRIFFVISNLLMPSFQKQKIWRSGGKTSAIDELEIAPTSAMKLSSWGIVIASAPVENKNVNI